MKNSRYLRLVCSCLVGLLIQTVGAADLGEMLSGYTPSGSGYDSAWSIFVGGDFTVEPGAIRAGGRVFVRKNLNLSTTYEVGGIGGLGARPPDNSEVLVVGDSVLGNGRVNLTAWGSYGYRARIQNTVSAGVAFGWSGEPLPLIGGVDNAAADQLIAELQQKSAYWGSLSSTPGGSIIEIDNSVYR